MSKDRDEETGGDVKPEDEFVTDMLESNDADASRDDDIFNVDRQVPDPLVSAYEGLLHKVQALPELPMQSTLVKREIDRLDPEQQVWFLDQLLRSALWGHPGGMETMQAAVWWLLQMRRNDEYETIKTFFETAHRTQRPSVIDLFREVPPYRALAEGQQLPEVRLPMGSEVTLGERRALAAGSKRRLLERLLQDPDPLVIEKLLDNPQIRLQDVRVAITRRPTTPDILQVVMEHPKWFSRHGAREAVVRNPYADTGLALKLLPTLGIKILRRIRYSGDLHELVQESATRLVTLREERTAPWRV